MSREPGQEFSKDSVEAKGKDAGPTESAVLVKSTRSVSEGPLLD